MSIFGFFIKHFKAGGLGISTQDQHRYHKLTIFIPTSFHLHSFVPSFSCQRPNIFGGKNFCPTNCAYAVLVNLTGLSTDVWGGKRIILCAAYRAVKNGRWKEIRHIHVVVCHPSYKKSRRLSVLRMGWLPRPWQCRPESTLS